MRGNRVPKHHGCVGVRPRLRRKVAFVAIVAIALVNLPAQAAELTGVRTSRRSEWVPAAAPGFLAWSETPQRRSSHFDLYAKADGEVRFRVNPAGTQAFAGSIEGTMLTYHQRSSRRKSDIKFYDLVTGLRTSAGDVNTRRNYESNPSRSGEWLLFRRSRMPFDSTQRILLHNLDTGEEQLLATGDGGRRWAQTGKVSGDYATWVKCPNLSFCNVFRKEISTGTVTQIPNPRRKALSAASVTPDGTVYFAQGNNISCSRAASIWRFTVEEGKSKIISLGQGRDTAVTSPVNNKDGSTTVFFDRFSNNCSLATTNIYKVTVP